MFFFCLLLFSTLFLFPPLPFFPVYHRHELYVVPTVYSLENVGFVGFVTTLV